MRHHSKVPRDVGPGYQQHPLGKRTSSTLSDHNKNDYGDLETNASQNNFDSPASLNSSARFADNTGGGSNANFTTNANTAAATTATNRVLDLARSFQIYYEAEKRAAKRSQRNVDIRAARINELTEFFQTPQTQAAPFPTIVSFLAMRGYSRNEMEEALEQCPNRREEYSILLSWVPGTELPDVKGTSNAKKEEQNLFAEFASNNNNNKNKIRQTATNSLHATSPSSGISKQQQQQQFHSTSSNNNNHQNNSNFDLKLQKLTQYWRIGGTVYVYLGKMRYAPIPLEAVDLSREGDILGIDNDNIRRFDPAVRKTLANPAAPLCCQGTHNLRNFAPGFKGVGTNQCVTADILHVGLILLVADPACEMGTFCEATVVGIHIDESSIPRKRKDKGNSNENNNNNNNDHDEYDFVQTTKSSFDMLDVDSSDEDTQISFTIDVEWSLTGEILKDIHPTDTRLFTHAEVLRAEMRYRRDQLRAARKGQKFSVDKVSSGANFPVSGSKILDESGDRASGNALRAIKLMNRRSNNNSLNGGTGHNNHHDDHVSNTNNNNMSKGFVKNFTKYPELSGDDCEPLHCRTSAEYISHFGEAKSGHERDSKTRRFPIHPESQKFKTGFGFGFDTSMYPRHNRSFNHFTLNPIIDVAFQCQKTNRKFIDPDFAPSFFSLFGTDKVSDLNLHHLPPFFTRDPEQLENDVVWRRLSDVFFRPRMHVVDSSPAQLRLGPFTPPWLECVVLSLCRNPEMVEEIISPGEDGWVFGAYAVRLLVEGQWHYVLVDDFVPCHPKNGQPLCFLTGKESEIYTAIIEKALAKVEGSYVNLYLKLRSEVTPGRIWNDLSGYVHEVIEHEYISDKANICGNILGLVNEEALDVAPLHVQAKSHGEEVASLVEHGFDRDSWWHLDYAVRFWDPPHDPVYFFRVYRGENVSFPVSGSAIQNAVFDGMDISVLDELPGVACDSSIYFWIDGNRFFDIFERTIVLRELRNSHKAFFEASFANRPNAGPPSHSAKFFSNPQLYLSVVQQADMIFHIELRDRRLLGGPVERKPLSKQITGEALQLYVLETHPVEEAITAQAVKNEPHVYRTISFSQPARVSDDEDAKTYPCVTLRCSLPGGCFVLVPTLGCPAQEEFTICIYSTASFQVSRLN